MDKPNVLFLLTDDQRRNTIHALGNEDIITPNMDYLVKEGTSFTNAYIPGGYTGAVCMPSRCMINTGRYLTSIQGNGEEIPESCITLGECLKSADYATFGTGKWHNGPKSFTRSFSSGKNAFFGGMWDHWNVPVNDYDPLGNYDNVINFVADFHHEKKVTKVHCDRFVPGKHSSELIADSTIEFLRNTPKEKPFFCYTAFLAPHDPRTMPEQYRKMYEGKEINLPKNLSNEYPVVYQGNWMRDEMLTPYPRTEKRTKEEIKDYYAMITHLDHEIGRIIDVLKKTGQEENTIIVLAGDNGLSLGSHGFMGKQNLYEESITVPLVMKGPGIRKGTIMDNKIYLMDIYPTLCDLLEIKIPDSVEGESFIDALRGVKGPSREEMYYIMMDRARGIRNGDFKFCIYTYPDAGKSSEVLFNIREDPLEITNLAQNSKYRSTKEHLKKRMFELKTNLNDTERKEAISFWTTIEKNSEQ